MRGNDIIPCHKVADKQLCLHRTCQITPAGIESEKFPMLSNFTQTTDEPNLGDIRHNIESDFKQLFLDISISTGAKYDKFSNKGR